MKSFNSLGPNNSKHFLRVLKTIISIVICMHLGFFLGGLFYILPLNQDDILRTAIMDYRLENNGIAAVSKKPVSLKKIPADLVNGIVLIEDIDFFRHQGFDLEAIQFAMRINSRLGYSAYGGSTITQQLARTLFLNPEKNYLRKYLELLLALELDWLISKERILELYLNNAEWGPGIYGIAAASRYHFQKPLQELDDRQKTILITLLANPLDYTAGDLAQGKGMRARTEAVRKALAYLHTRKPQFKSKVRELD